MLRRFAIFIIGINCLVAGCNGPNLPQSRLSTAPASVQSQAVTAEIQRADGDLAAVLPTVQAITPDNIPASKATITGGVNSARQHLGVASTQSAAVESAAKKTETALTQQTDENAKLKENTAIRNRFANTGYWAVGLCVAGLIASLFAGALLAAPIMSQVRSGLLVGLASGFACLAISWFYVELMIAFGILIGVTLLALLVWAVAWGIKNRGRLLNVIGSIEAGKAAGEVTIKPNSPVVKAYQADDVSHIVNSLQPDPVKPNPSVP